jgi:alkylation response protein AidB-like acyl-CoA dehydrogenase
MTAEADVLRVVENVKALQTEISERAEEIEQAHAVPFDLVEKLRAAGVFRRYVPRSHGGDELWPDDGVTVIEELARADGSIAWIAAVGSEAPAFMAYLPQETFDKIYSDGPDVIIAGSALPHGSAVPVPGGYRYTGQWSFASGCTHADYILMCSPVEQLHGSGTNGPPVTRFGIVPAREVEILDTWRVMGLKGTGSNDFVAEELFIPEDWTGNFAELPKADSHPLDRRPLLARFGVEFAAVGLGVAMGALDDIVAIARKKYPIGEQGRLDADPVLQHMVGGFVTDLRMARCLLHDVARADQASVFGAPLDEGAIYRRLACLARVTSVSAAVVDGCYDASGTTGLHEASPLQRRLRDVRAVTQNILLSTRRAFAPAGASILNEESAT